MEVDKQQKVPAPERVIKKKKVTKERAAALEAMKKQKGYKKQMFYQEIVKRAQKYRRIYVSTAKSVKLHKKQANLHGNFYVPSEAKVAFVIRIRGINDMPPKERKILQLFRLRQIFNGVFVKLNKATINMLNRINPYIAWGYPSRETIHKLIYKRGFAKVNGQRLKLTDNDIISKNLSRKGLICMEDLVFQIATCGEKFREVTRFLWPFKLSAPRGGLRAKRKHFVEGANSFPHPPRLP
eukprot:NODE_912_length_1096_cov_863.750716_g747_i0.p1 GENE.NODE_912_length_1096_cov_863.750716_g747_i0~~NODE_912_length_1096_cov_863.750716_g747_i0.p1  ORF type:complete len:239 (-),score=77.95 NODE_912_length_1096_cov_863.750716_g747_i0:319-1035(-)